MATNNEMITCEVTKQIQLFSVEMFNKKQKAALRKFCADSTGLLLSDQTSMYDVACLSKLAASDVRIVTIPEFLPLREQARALNLHFLDFDHLFRCYAHHNSLCYYHVFFVSSMSYYSFHKYFVRDHNPVSPVPVPDSDFQTQGHTHRRDSVQQRMVLHSRRCYANSDCKHTWEYCHLNPKAKSKVWCKSCFGPRSVLPQPFRDFEFDVQGLQDWLPSFKTEVGLSSELNEKIDEVLNRATSISSDLAETVDSATTSTNQNFREMVELLRQIREEGVKVNHNFGSKPRETDPDKSSSSFTSMALTYLPSILSIAVALLSDLSLAAKAILILPACQQLYANFSLQDVMAHIGDFVFSSDTNRGSTRDSTFSTEGPADTFSSLSGVFFRLLCKLCGLDSKVADVDKVLRRLDLIPKAIRGGIQLIEWVMSIFKEVIRFCCSKLNLENPFATEIEQTLKPFLERCDALLGVIPSLDTFDAKHVDSLFEVYRLGLKLQGEFASMKVPAAHMQILSQRLVALKRKCDAMSHLAFASGPRPEPLFLYLWGESGVGKSGAVNLMQIDIAKIDEDMDPEQWVKNIYMRFPEQEYHDGANNDNLIEYYDDAFQIFDSKNTPDPTLLEVIRLGNIIPYPRHMADVADKGFIFAKPRIVILSSNVESPTINSLQCPKAFENRINLKFQVLNNQAVVQVRGSPTTLREYNRHKMQMNPFADPLDPSVYLFKGNYRGQTICVNYTEFISILAYEYRLNLCRTGDTRGFYDTYAKSPINLVDVSMYTQGDIQDIFKLAVSPQIKLSILEAHTRLTAHAVSATLTEKEFKEFSDILQFHNIPSPCGSSDSFYDLPDSCLTGVELAYKTICAIEADGLPSAFDSVLEFYRGSVAEVTEARPFLAKLLTTCTFTGWCLSINVLGQLHAYLEARPEIRMNLSRYFDEQCVRLQVPVEFSDADNAKPFDALIFQIMQRSGGHLARAGYKIEMRFKQGGMSKAAYLEYGRVFHQVGTDKIEADIAKWLHSLSESDLSVFFRVIMATKFSPAELKASLSTEYKLTTWARFRRTVLNTSWGLFDSLLVSHPTLALILGVVVTYTASAASWALISYLFSSVSDSVGSSFKGVFSTESVVSKTAKPKIFISESVVSKTAKPKGFVVESIVSKNARPRQFVTESDSDFQTAGFVDNNTQSLISSKALGNMRILKTGRPGMNIALNGCIMKGRCFLTYKHAVEQFCELASVSENIEMYSSDGVLMYNMSPSSLNYVFHESSDGLFEDLCMIVLPRSVAPGKDISKHVITVDDYRKVDGRECTLVTPQYREGSNHVAYRISDATILTNRGYVDNGVSRTCAKLIETRMETQKGDCGSVLFSMNPSLPRKICGLHVAASTAGIARAIPITQEKLSCMFSICETISPGCSSFSHEVSSSFTPTEIFSSQSELPIPGNFTYEGELLKPASIGSVSSLYSSPISGVLAQSVVRPAFLRPMEVDGVTVDPMMKSLKKAGQALPALDTSIVKECSDDIYRLIWNSDPKRYVRLLTIDEAIHGVENDQYLPSLCTSTSPGYPYSTLKSKGKTGKASWIKHSDESGPAWVCPTLIAEVEDILSKASQGERSGVLYLDFPKDETRPIEKVMAMKTRSVNCSPLPFTVACRVAFGAFCSSQMRGRILNGSSIGVNPYGSEWNTLATHMKVHGNNIIAGDYGNWDGGISTELLWGAFDVIDSWYGDDGNSTLRRTLFEDIASSTHVFKSFVYSWLHSMPSGCYLTACVNTIINNLIVRLAWKSSVPLSLSSMREFNRNVVTTALGDDHLVGVSNDVVQMFNQTHLQVFAESLGMTYTDESKSDRRDITFRPIEEVEFLKRGFHFDESLARYVGRLSYSSICENFNWLRRGIPTKLALQLNCECAFRELSLYDKDTYETAASKVVSAFRDAKISLPVIPSWLSNRSKVAIDGEWIFSDL
jgi:hypothetical protein